MKNIKYILVLLTIVFTSVSCEVDDLATDLNLTEASVPNITKLPLPIAQSISRASIAAGNVTFGVKVDRGLGEIKSLDLIGFYTYGPTNARVTTAPVVLKSCITTFPVNFEFNQNDLITAFPYLTSIISFVNGDVLTVTANITMNDGRVIKMMNDDGSNNYGAEFNGSVLFKVKQTYSVVN